MKSTFEAELEGKRIKSHLPNNRAGIPCSIEYLIVGSVTVFIFILFVLAAMGYLRFGMGAG